MLFRAGDVFEIRVLGATRKGYHIPHPESGYFEYAEIDSAASAIMELASYTGVYVTMNPVNPALLARAKNRLKPGQKRESTSDTDIVHRRWMIVDCDPVRPAGISATDAEKKHALGKANEIREGLGSTGWPAPAVVDSGNGYYLLYRIGLPSDDGGLIHRALQALASVNDEYTHVDTSMANASRIIRIAGTRNRKGDDTADRPWRDAVMLSESGDGVVPRMLIDELAECVVTTAPREYRPAAQHDRPGDHFNEAGDLAAVLERHGWQNIGDTGDNQLWRRPGKMTGQHSATFDGKTFYVFSSAAPPFEPNTGYSPFAVLTILDYGGDYAESCRGIGGYGDDSDVDLSAIMSCHLPEDEPERPREGDPGQLPDEAFVVPGFIGEVMAHTLATAPYPNVALAFAGAVCLQSYLCGRRVRDKMDNRSNIYMVALASSGVGKDHPRQVNSEIAYQAGILRGIGDSFASGEGIEDAMFIQNCMLFQADEIDAILGGISKSRDGRNEMIMQILLKMYGSSRTRYPLRKKAGQTEPLVIQQPSLTLMGTAVPQYFYQALSGKMLNNGMFARCIVLDAGARSRGRVPVAQEVPAHVLAVARAWSVPMGGNLAGIDPEPKLVPDAPDAGEITREIWALTDDAYEAAQADGDETRMAIWARALEKVRKLALIYACSENHENPVITGAGIRWAWAIVEHQTRRMLWMADLYVADGEFEGLCKKLVAILEKAPMKTMKRSDLLNKMKCKSGELNELVDTIEQQGKLEKITIESRTKTAIGYRLV